MKNFSDYILGKKVVIVGPAPSIVGTGQHDKIESYDIVIRLNHALPVPSKLHKDIGERTDVLYTTTKAKSLHSDFDFLQKTLKWIVCPYADVEPFDRYMVQFKKKNKDRIPFVCAYSHNEYHQVLTSIGTRPTIGLSAIIHMLKHEISELYITGMTFYKKTPGNKGGYYEEYKNKDDYKGKATEKEVLALTNKIGVHNMDRHVDAMRILMQDDRVVCDEALKYVLD
jgi:hypothetical protein